MLYGTIPLSVRATILYSPIYLADASAFDGLACHVDQWLHYLCEYVLHCSILYQITATHCYPVWMQYERTG